MPKNVEQKQRQCTVECTRTSSMARVRGRSVTRQTLWRDVFLRTPKCVVCLRACGFIPGVLDASLHLSVEVGRTTWGHNRREEINHRNIFLFSAFASAVLALLFFIATRFWPIPFPRRLFQANSVNLRKEYQLFVEYSLATFSFRVRNSPAVIRFHNLLVDSGSFEGTH